MIDIAESTLAEQQFAAIHVGHVGAPLVSSAKPAESEDEHRELLRLRVENRKLWQWIFCAGVLAAIMTFNAVTWFYVALKFLEVMPIHH